MAGRLEDRGVLADGDLEPAGVLQGVRQVKCLVAVAVVLALPAREQEDLRAVGCLLLRQGRRAKTHDKTRLRPTCGVRFTGVLLPGSSTW